MSKNKKFKERPYALDKRVCPDFYSQKLLQGNENDHWYVARKNERKNAISEFLTPLYVSQYRNLG